MPTVPRYGPLKVATRPLPGARKQAGETEVSSGAALSGTEAAAARRRGAAGVAQAEALGAIGEGAAQLGTVAAREVLAQRQETQDFADRMRDVETQNQLATIETDLLRNPEYGALNTTGPATLGKTRETLDAYDQRAAAVGAGLSSPRQKLAFATAHAGGRLRIQGTLDAHAQSEMRRWSNTELTAFVANQQREALNAAAQLAVPDQEQAARVTITAALNAATEQIQELGPRLGMGPAVVDQAVTQTQSAIHAGVVTALLAQDQTAKAQQYFDEVTKAGQLADPEQRARLTKMLETGTAEQAGSQAADAIWRELGPKGETDPINLDTMETAARDKFKDDPKKRQATIQQLRERKVGVDAGRQDRKEAVSGTLWSAVAQGVSLNQLRTMPAYLAAPGPLQVQLRDYLVSEAERRQARAEAADARTEQVQTRAERERETEGWAMFWHYNTPEVLTQMSENQILGLIPTLGIAHTNRLLETKRRIGRSDDTVRAATIDDNLFKTVAASAGRDPFNSKRPDSAKAADAQLQVAVETEIDRQQTASGKVLTREQKTAVMQHIVDQQVMVDTWGGDEWAIAAVMSASDKEVAYVPLDRIPPEAQTDLVNLMQSFNRRAVPLTTAQVLARYKAQIQRAHAARVLKLSEKEVGRRLLEGIPAADRLKEP